MDNEKRQTLRQLAEEVLGRKLPPKPTTPEARQQLAAELDKDLWAKIPSPFKK